MRTAVVEAMIPDIVAELTAMELGIRVATICQLPADMREAVFAKMTPGSVAEVHSTKAQELMSLALDARVEAVCQLPVDIRHAVLAELSAEAVAQLDFTPQIPESFHDLMAAKGGCIIPDTERRAISLDQLECIMKHMERRLGSGEVLSYLPSYKGASERTIQSVQDANLYDANALVIMPATEGKKCSLVEIMAMGAQQPDYFVSHWWGEPVVLFLRCLKQHSKDRGLESKAGYFAGEAYGGVENSCEATGFQQLVEHAEPHPGYLGGQSPLYWVW
jgi:hypothetical protein